MRVLEAVSNAIAEEGIDHLFGVIGDANQDLIVDLAEKHNVKFVQSHHEGSGVGMADGYARFSGKAGLATVTQGPGLTNASPRWLRPGFTALRYCYWPATRL
jgi:thiamine pyrophosphate-dependent acetolactate synthase large subunit-like protein